MTLTLYEYTSLLIKRTCTTERGLQRTQILSTDSLFQMYEEINYFLFLKLQNYTSCFLFFICKHTTNVIKIEIMSNMRTIANIFNFPKSSLCMITPITRSLVNGHYNLFIDSFKVESNIVESFILFILSKKGNKRYLFLLVTLLLLKWVHTVYSCTFLLISMCFSFSCFLE